MRLLSGEGSKGDLTAAIANRKRDSRVTGRIEMRCNAFPKAESFSPSGKTAQHELSE